MSAATTIKADKNNVITLEVGGNVKVLSGAKIVAAKTRKKVNTTIANAVRKKDSTFAEGWY
jgi:hypothetical protein